MRHASWIGLCCLLGLAAGCGDSPAASDGAVRRDSAGIAIVENRAPRWTADSGWRVSPEPSLVIGGSASPDGEQFANAMATTRFRDGRILVGDRSEWKVRVYDRTGRQVASFGRRGQGPGELQDISRIMRAPGDSIAIPSGMRGLMIFDDQGTYGRMIALRPDPAATIPIPPGIVGLLPDGAWLAVGPRMSDPRRTGSWTDSIAVMRVSPSGDSTTTLGVFPTAERHSSGPPLGPMPVAFGPAGIVAPGGPGYCWGNGGDYEIRCHTVAGALARIIRREGERAPVTDELKRRYREHLTSFPVEPGMDVQRMKEHFRRVADATRFAERLPFFRRFQLDAAGYLWVKNYEPADDMPRVTDVRSFPLSAEPSSWSVFDPDGVWLGDVELPAGFAPIEIGADYVLGFGRDADENQQVWQLRLERR